MTHDIYNIDHRHCVKLADVAPEGFTNVQFVERNREGHWYFVSNQETVRTVDLNPTKDSIAAM